MKKKKTKLRVTYTISYDLEFNDEVPGHIIRNKIKPYLNQGMRNTCRATPSIFYVNPGKNGEAEYFADPKRVKVRTYIEPL